MESNFPKHVWELMILPRLSLKDIIRFSAVSHSWKSIAAENLNRLIRIPWMMLSRDETTNTGTFFSLSDSKLYQLRLSPLVSETGTHCSGSCQGYLVMAKWDGNFLFNPFSKNLVRLPKHYIPPEDFFIEGRYYFHRTTLAAMSNTSMHIVSAICCNFRIIQMCRPSDPEWSVFGVDKVEKKKEILGWGSLYDEDQEQEEQEQKVELEEKEAENNDLLFSDLLWYKGVLHGLTESNRLVTFDFHDSVEPPVCTVLNMLPMDTSSHAESEHTFSYLVESQGELLLVYRFAVFVRDEMLMTKFVTKRFLVFKLDQCEDPLCWVQVESLGGEMLFVGGNTSLSVPAQGLPRFKGNCIYFSSVTLPFLVQNSWKHCYFDNGVFYLEDGRIESFSIVDDFLPSTFKPPVGVMPDINPPGTFSSVSNFIPAAPVWVTPDIRLDT